MAIDIIARAMAKKAADDAAAAAAINDDTIYEFEGTILPNKKYYYSASADFTLTLDEVDYQDKEVQFILYLECTADIDITFAGDPLDLNSTFNNAPLLVGGAINTDTGYHKIFGSWNDQAKRWCIGSVDYEVGG